MKHYIPWPTQTGYAVAYMNHRAELVAVMECPTLESAYNEAQAMTQRAMQEAGMRQQSTGNRYLRRFA